MRCKEGEVMMKRIAKGMTKLPSGSALRLGSLWWAALACCWVVAAGGAQAEEPQRSGPLFELLCKGQALCQVQTVYDAGKSPKGVPLKVVEVGLHHQADGGQERPKWDPEAEDSEMCYTNQYWLVEEGAAPKTTLIFDVCNDGYGASGVGEDAITVGQNRLTHDQHGGSAERWNQHTVWELSPLRVVEVGHGGFMTWSYEAEDDTVVSWERFTGRQTKGVAACGANGMLGDDSVVHQFASSLIPHLPALPGDKGWKETRLGACAVAVDSSGEGGFITHGKPGEAADAKLRALLVGERVLYVEVEDDTFTTGAAKWLHDDHVELWFVPKGEIGFPDCFEPKKTTTHQWGIMLDGKVHAAHGKPKAAPKVEAHKVDDRTYRLRIELPSDFDALTVVYSDSDDGKSQERLLATSKLVFGEAHSVGGTFDVGEKAPVTCRLKGDTLAPTWR
jgi:hypothetical protein